MLVFFQLNTNSNQFKTLDIEFKYAQTEAHRSNYAIFLLLIPVLHIANENDNNFVCSTNLFVGTNKRSFQCYSDDTQLYMAITPTSKWIYTTSRLQICLFDLGYWMRSNYLKSNKKQIIFLAPKHKIYYFKELSNNFVGNKAYVSSIVKMYDLVMNMDQQIKNIAKQC